MDSYFKFLSSWSRSDYSLSGYVKYHRIVRTIALFLLAITFFSYFFGTKPSQHLRQAHIARVDIGSVANYNATWLSDLRVALDNPNALGIMLVVDQASSMGGDFFDIESAIGRIRAARDNKPVVTYVYGYALGGNYVLASETNYIVAQRTATLGGLSVAVSSFDPKPFLRRIGIDVVTKGFGDLKVMPDKDDKNYDSYIQHRNEVYRNLYHWMLSSVQENRNLSVDNMKKIAEGQWYLGERAQGYGLCDAIGDMYVAADRLRLILGVDAQTPVLDYSNNALVEYNDAPMLNSISRLFQWSWQRATTVMMNEVMRTFTQMANRSYHQMLYR